MGRRRQNQKSVECVVYISVSGELYDIDRQQAKQERYIREYAKAHNIKIVGIIRSNGLGQESVNRHWNQIVNLMKAKRIEGVVLANMGNISTSMADAYHKVGKAVEVGGTVITVDEGRLEMKVRGLKDGE